YAKDELLRVEGISDINVQGLRDYSMRVWLDPQKLAARSMTAADVADAIRSQNVDAPAGRIGQPPIRQGQAFQFPLDTLGRLSDPEQFGNIIVKGGGRVSALSPTGMVMEAPRAGKPSGAKTGGISMSSNPMAGRSSGGGSSATTSGNGNPATTS